MRQVIAGIVSAGTAGKPCAFAVELRCENMRRAITGGSMCSTPQRQLYRGVIAALQAIKSPARVTVYTNAQWLIKVMRAGATVAANADLHREAVAAGAEHITSYQWINAFPGAVMLKDLARQQCTKPLGGDDMGDETTAHTLQMGLFNG